MLADTALDLRQELLRQFRSTLSALNQPTWLELTGEPREMMTDERVTLRSPVTLRLGNLPPLHGTAGILVQRRGEIVMWIVAHVARGAAPPWMPPWSPCSPPFAPPRRSRPPGHG